MSNKAFALVLTTALLAGSAACNKKEAPAPAASSTPAPATPAPAATPPVPVPPPPPKPVPEKLPDVIAKVGNENITKSDFDLLITNLRAQNQNKPIPPERRDEILRGVLDQLLTYTVLKQEVEARSIVVDPKEIEAEIDKLRQGAGGDAGLKKALKSRGMSIERLREDARVQMSINKMMNAQMGSVPEATDAEAKDFYDKNPDQFKQQEAVRASHILILANEKSSEAEKKAARERIEKVLVRAKAGEDFAVLAREHSQDGSAAQGGDLNYFVKGKMVQPFDEAAFKLKTNEISDIVTTEFGYHIIKVVDHKQPGTMPLAEVNTQVKQMLTEQKRQQAGEAFITQLKQKRKIEVLI